MERIVVLVGGRKVSRQLLVKGVLVRWDVVGGSLGDEGSLRGGEEGDMQRARLRNDWIELARPFRAGRGGCKEDLR